MVGDMVGVQSQDKKLLVARSLPPEQEATSLNGTKMPRVLLAYSQSLDLSRCPPKLYSYADSQILSPFSLSLLDLELKTKISHTHSLILSLRSFSLLSFSQRIVLFFCCLRHSRVVCARGQSL